jgi:hypothetical protein
MRLRLALLALLLLAGCGGSAGRQAAAPPAATPEPLVYLSRNWEYAVPEDVAVYADGRVQYRYLLHTRINMRVRRLRLDPGSLSGIRRLVAHTDLDGAQVLGVEPPRGAYRYTLRIGGRTITTVDGHLSSGVRPLIRRLGRLQDRMLAAGDSS